MRDFVKCSFSYILTNFCASAQRSVAGGGILFLTCSSVRACVRLCVRHESLLTRYPAEYLIHFHQNLKIISYRNRVIANTAVVGPQCGVC